MKKVNQNMKSKIAIVGLLILIPGLPLLITGCASPGPLAVKQASYPEDKVDARGLFVENCTVCHGKNGRAHTFHGILVGAQNLTKANWQTNTADDEIVYAIKTGPREMPAFEKKLSASEIDALVKYVRTFKQTL
jgi:mono/diheme cytochrome c family protein